MSRLVRDIAILPPHILSPEGSFMSKTSLYYAKLIVDDAEALAPFYRDVLGMKEIRRIYEPEHARPHLEIYMSAGDSEQICLMQYIGRPTPPPGEVRIAFLVESVDKAVATSQAMGGGIILPPETIEQHNFRWATISDPQGHAIELMQFGV